MKFAGDDDRIIAVQGEHPPARGVAGHMIAVDLSGTELWRVRTGDECWGFDVSPNGRIAAATCHDGFLYIVGDRGQLLHKISLTAPGGRNGETRFSPDGSRVLAGYGGRFKVVNVDDGRVVWESATQPQGEEVGAYRGRWSSDGQRLVTGFGGPVAAFTRDGQRLWTAHMGSSPLFLEVDEAYRLRRRQEQRVIQLGSQRHTALEIPVVGDVQRRHARYVHRRPLHGHSRV